MLNTEMIREALSGYYMGDHYNQYNHVVAEKSTSYLEEGLDPNEYESDYKSTNIEVVRVNETDWVCYLTTHYWDAYTDKETLIGLLTIELGSEPESLKGLVEMIEFEHNRAQPTKEAPLGLNLFN